MSEIPWPPDPFLHGANLHFRAATLADAPILERWDRDPDVIASTTDNADAEIAFGDHDWPQELKAQTPANFFVIALLDDRPCGAMQIIDPKLEPTHYWGEIAPNLRAIDIWIGEPACRGKGFGRLMMLSALGMCFHDPKITAVLIDPLNSNTRAHRFYHRLGFVPTHRQIFNGEDDCLVHRLDRSAWERLQAQPPALPAPLPAGDPAPLPTSAPISFASNAGPSPAPDNDNES